MDKNNEADIDIDTLLKEKITLYDGSEHFIFSRGPIQLDNSLPINCHLCSISFPTNEEFKAHISNTDGDNNNKHRCTLQEYKTSKNFKNFTESLKKPFWGRIGLKRKQLYHPFKIYAGEDISGVKAVYNDRIVRPDEFVAKLSPNLEKTKRLKRELLHDYNRKMPVMGLSYIYKMMTRKGIKYYCTLCDVYQNKSVTIHALSARHNKNYIDKHFQKLKQSIKDRFVKNKMKNLDKNMFDIFRKLYRKIEEIKGLHRIQIIDEESFINDTGYYIQRSKCIKNYNEETIPINEEVVDDLIQKCVDKVEFIKPDYIVEELLNNIRNRKRKLVSSDDRDSKRYHETPHREEDDLHKKYEENKLYPTEHPLYTAKEDNIFRACKRQDMRTRSPSPPRMMRSSYDYDRRMYADHYADQRNMNMLEPVASQVSSRPSGVISCLRLLAALEDQLGSLGPKALQLLGRAVLFEKGGKNPNDLLLENEFYVFFMTVERKLKEQLFANIFDHTKTSLVIRAREDIDALLKVFDKYMEHQDKFIPMMESDSGMKGNRHEMNNYSSALGSGDRSRDQYRFGNSDDVWQTGFNASLNRVSSPFNPYSKTSNMGNFNEYNF